MSDERGPIEARLRHAAKLMANARQEYVVAGLMDSAANEIERLRAELEFSQARIDEMRAEVEQLREALRPFVEAQAFDDPCGQISARDLELAREALETIEPEANTQAAAENLETISGYTIRDGFYYCDECGQESSPHDAMTGGWHINKCSRSSISLAAPEQDGK